MLLFRTTHGVRICLPINKLHEALHTAHDVLGHFGRAKTHARVMETFYRPGLATAVVEYVRHCPDCSVNKLHNSWMFGKPGVIGSKKPGLEKRKCLVFYRYVLIAERRALLAGSQIPVHLPGGLPAQSRYTSIPLHLLSGYDYRSRAG